MGAENVFLDVDNIQPGSDFVQVLTESVGACDALVAVIGRRWITDENNRRRLDDPQDFVRIEIETALQRGVRVFPVLVDSAPMPKSNDLPEALKRLSRKQWIEISHTRFDSDVEKLIRALSNLEKRLLKAAIPKKTKATTPQNVGVLTPNAELLFSPTRSGSGSVPKLQIGQSGVSFVRPSGPFGKPGPYGISIQGRVDWRQGKSIHSDANDTGSLLIEIIRNEWLVAPPPQTWDRNYSDDALEVRDGSGRIVLQVRSLLDRIQIQGMWWVDLGPQTGLGA